MATFSVTENFGTYQGNTSYILDGSTSQTWRADAQQSSGKYVLVTANETIHVNSVTYSTGQSSEIFGNGAYLQISADGSSYEDIGQFTGSQSQTFTVNKDAKYIRIYCKSGSGYVSISELAIDYSDAGGSGGGGGGGSTATEEFTPAAFNSDHAYYSGSNTSNPIGQGSTSNSYAQFYLTTGSMAVTYFSYSFDTSNIPANAIIKSVQCQARSYISTTNSRYVSTRQVQLYSGDTAKGSAYTISSSTTAYSISAGTWTRAELSNARIRFNVVRGTSYTTSNYYVRFYGATLTVTYELPQEQGTQYRIKVDGTYKKVLKIYKKQNGSWTEVDESAIDTSKKVVIK